MRHRLDFDPEARGLPHLAQRNRHLRAHRRTVGRDQLHVDAIRIAGGSEQRLRLHQIGLLQRHVAVVAIGGIERCVVPRRSETLGDKLDHLAAIDAQRHRLPHARIVERLLVTAEIDIAELTGRCPQPLDTRRLGQARELRRRRRQDQVGIAGDQRRAFRGRIGIDEDLDPIEVRTTAVVIRVIALHDNLPFRLVRHQLERTGADRLAIESLQAGLDHGGRDDLRVGIRERHRQVGERRRQVEDHGVIVLRAHLGDRPDVLSCRRRGLWIEDRLERRHDIVGVARAAVVEYEPLAEHERPFGEVRGARPRGGQIGLRGHVVAEPRQRGIQQLGDQVLGSHANRHRIELADRLIDAHPERSAATWRRLRPYVGGHVGHCEPRQGGARGQETAAIEVRHDSNSLIKSNDRDRS